MIEALDIYNRAKDKIRTFYTSRLNEGGDVSLLYSFYNTQGGHQLQNFEKVFREIESILSSELLELVLSTESAD